MTLPTPETPPPVEPPASATPAQPLDEHTAGTAAPAESSTEGLGGAPAAEAPAAPTNPAPPAAEPPAEAAPASQAPAPTGAAAPAPAVPADAPAAAAPAAPVSDQSSALLSEPALPAVRVPAGPAPSPTPGELPPAPAAPQGVFMTPPPMAAPAPPTAPAPVPPPMATGPIPTGVLPAPRKPSKAGVITLAIALVVVALVAGTFAYLYTQAADEADANAAEIEELLAAEEDLKAENSELVNDLAGLQLTADDYEACQTAFDAYNNLEFEGDINPDAENLEDLFTDEYIDYQNELAELYQEVIVKCSP